MPPDADQNFFSAAKQASAQIAAAFEAPLDKREISDEALFDAE